MCDNKLILKLKLFPPKTPFNSNCVRFSLAVHLMTFHKLIYNEKVGVVNKEITTGAVGHRFNSRAVKSDTYTLSACPTFGGF